MNQILLYAIPAFLILIAIEIVVDRRRGTGYYRVNDAIGSLALGLLSQTSKLVIFSLFVVFLDKVLPAVRLFELSETSVWVWIFAFVAYDFSYYWLHRMGHTLNIFWAGHSIHHQSEDYNLSTALRQTSSAVFSWVFSVPLLMLGISVEMLLTCAALNLVYQFWVHTQHIGKLGAFEWVFVTPSNHRVHHGQNPIYIDKNHGGVFILWDRMFGTFQEELDDEAVVYGVTSPLRSFNPVKANFQHWSVLVRDAWNTRSWWDKCRIWFMPTGWRPADVAAAAPLPKSDLDAFRKYDPQVAPEVRVYAVLQYALCLVPSLLFLTQFNDAAYSSLLLGFALITAPLVSIGYLLEGKTWSLEAYRLLASGLLLLLGGAWFDALTLQVFTGYCLLSALLFVGFVLPAKVRSGISDSETGLVE